MDVGWNPPVGPLPRRGGVKTPPYTAPIRGAITLGCGPGMPGPYKRDEEQNTKKAELSLCLGVL